MSTPRQSDEYHLDSAREHVLTPIATATSVVEAERAEVEAERRAYVRFGDRVADEEVYDEPLVEHAARELSTEVAAGFHQETSPGFTELYKTALTTAVSEAVDQRETLCEQFRTELKSLKRCHSSLDELSRSRQRGIQQRYPGSRADGHDLCQYLYEEFDWTYPALTAVTRFYDTMV